MTLPGFAQILLNVALATAAASPESSPPLAPPAGSAREGAVGPRTTAADTPGSRELSPLPKPPSLDLPVPEPAMLEALDVQLNRLVSRDVSVRETAMQEILETERGLLPAIHRRLASIAESSDHQAMKELLGGIRDKARDSLRDRARAAGAKVETPDYLEMLESHPRLDSRVFRDLVSVVAMSRMLRQIGSVAACRELVGVHARFGEFLRVDTQLQLQALGDRAVAALIEATRHPAPKIAQWAARQLDALGKAIPGEAVQTNDPEVLADILRAYGRARDPDAARLVISFANSERTQIREASRQAVALLGEVGNWQLRDTYENVTGKKPPRDWSWDRTARELFTQFDRLRLSQVFVTFEQGLSSYRAGKLDEMAEAFDQVLAQSPVFERSSEMIPGYLAYARAHVDDAPEKSGHALHRVARLAGEGAPESKPARSLLITLDAERELARGIAEPLLLRRALELDATNARARRLLDRLARGGPEPEDRLHRYLGAGAVFVSALGAILFILLRKGPKSAPPPADPDRKNPSEDPDEAPPPAANEVHSPDAPGTAPEKAPEADAPGTAPEGAAPGRDAGSSNANAEPDESSGSA